MRNPFAQPSAPLRAATGLALALGLLLLVRWGGTCGRESLAAEEVMETREVVFDLLAETGLADETVVVFTRDHGEELFDHGLLSHGHGVHAELVHVPLVLAGPGIEAGVRVDTPVSNRHLAPTLAALGGGRLPDLVDPVDLVTGEGTTDLLRRIGYIDDGDDH